MTLPAGTYSDDTQLRLAVCRATRGSGEFDVEAFAKVELVLWPAYSLGAGRATSAAAANLARSNVSWFANFFGKRQQQGYFEAGGNGAAMRVQPHAWKSRATDSLALMLDVLRDAIVTHGHPQGFCGAIFHALCVEHALKLGSIADPVDWRRMLQQLDAMPEIVGGDQQLRLFWLPAWEAATRIGLGDAVRLEVNIALAGLDRLENYLGRSKDEAYEAVLSVFSGREPDQRGAGLGTALIAACLAWIHRSTSNKEALIHAASSLASDTDTIASMAGAILGASRPEAMSWPLQDRDYIVREATRLARATPGSGEATFNYPDVMAWEPPSSQLDAVAEVDGGFVLRGLGQVRPQEEPVASGEQIWQWMRLNFGQTVLVKRRAKPRAARAGDLPVHYRIGGDLKPGVLFDNMSQTAPTPQGSAHRPSSTAMLRAAIIPRAEVREPAPQRWSDGDLDDLTDRIIRADFDPVTIGQVFLELVSGERPVEHAIAFAAILAKAVVSRKRRNLVRVDQQRR